MCTSVCFIILSIINLIVLCCILLLFIAANTMPSPAVLLYNTMKDMICYSSFEYIDHVGSKGYFSQSETELATEYNYIFHCGV